MACPFEPGMSPHHFDGEMADLSTYPDVTSSVALVTPVDAEVTGVSKSLPGSVACGARARTRTATQAAEPGRVDDGLQGSRGRLKGFGDELPEEERNRCPVHRQRWYIERSMRGRQDSRTT